MDTLTATATISIKAPAEKIWEALTTPELVKQWMFGTTVASNWQKGGDITYSGVWEDKPYEDKGTILNVIPGRLLETSYWSASFGPDTPENRKMVTYAIKPESNGALVTITQGGNKDETERATHEGNWRMVLEKLKTLVEGLPTH
ncbi:MAG TPA: SRPBCC domain-containing protein [Candidatus Paceibacterota bacterium]|nr:SRPBCC domain-containing protein [Candidatus Paceibacterota bacterium]